jgi:hypothetical protein
VGEVRVALCARGYVGQGSSDLQPEPLHWHVHGALAVALDPAMCGAARMIGPGCA